MKLDLNIPIGVEKWAPLNYNGKILSRYSVSDHGRIYDHKRNECLPYYHQRGLYWYARVHVNHSVTASVAVHRAVLMAFKPHPNFDDDIEVNHIDGNPQNNNLNNLEWVTSEINTLHAIKTGLRKQNGTDNGRAVYSDEEVHEICKLIDQGYGNAQIANILNHLEEPERSSFCANVSSIKYGKTRRDISVQYNFMKGNVFKLYSNDFAHLVCNFLSDPNRDYTYDEIADYLQIPKNERVNFKQFVNKIILGREAKNVSPIYDIKRPLDYYDDCKKGYENRKYS